MSVIHIGSFFAWILVLPHVPLPSLYSTLFYILCCSCICTHIYRRIYLDLPLFSVSAPENKRKSFHRSCKGVKYVAMIIIRWWRGGKNKNLNTCHLHSKPISKTGCTYIICYIILISASVYYVNVFSSLLLLLFFFYVCHIILLQRVNMYNGAREHCKTIVGRQIINTIKKFGCIGSGKHCLMICDSNNVFVSIFWQMFVFKKY